MMASITKPNRDTTIDTVKFLLIFGIFVFHYGTNAGGLYLFFAQFHVPAFFVISGFWAMKKLDIYIWDYIKNAFNKYLILWLVWACIYSALYFVVSGYDIKHALLMFKNYLLAYRGSGIAGMWFVPVFFLVGLCYFLVAKTLKRFLKINETAQALIHSGIALIITLSLRNLFTTKDQWIFSIDQVPIHWLYYAMGRVIYIGYQWLITKSKPLRNSILIISATVSFPYMVLMYLYPNYKIWGTVREKLPLLPPIIGVLMALCGLFWIAKFIKCKFFAYIGQSTLGLCLCEIATKTIIKEIMDVFGWTINHPLIAVVCSIIALLMGRFVIIPPIDFSINFIKKRIFCFQKNQHNIEKT